MASPSLQHGEGASGRGLSDRTHSLSALSSLGNDVVGHGHDSSIWDSQPIFASAFSAEPKTGQPEVEASFPEFRPDDSGWMMRRSLEQGGRVVPPPHRPKSSLISDFSDAVAAELCQKLRDTLRDSFDGRALESYVRRARDRVAGEEDASSNQQQSPQDKKIDDDVRNTVASMASRLSTLEGRQRALQGKMAKLDSHWGGDASQMSVAIAELQNQPAVELGSLRGQVIALAHSIDKLDKRTAAIERRLTQGPPPGPPGQQQTTSVTIDSSYDSPHYYAPPPHHHHHQHHPRGTYYANHPQQNAKHHRAAGVGGGGGGPKPLAGPVVTSHPSITPAPTGRGGNANSPSPTSS